MPDRIIVSRPYGDASRDAVYHLLFADDLEAFRRAGGAVASDPPDIAALTAIAADRAAESRLRILAYRRLAATGATTPGELGSLPLLGVIVEVWMAEGLDALAVYADGSVRHLNHAGGATFAEGEPSLDPGVQALLTAAEPLARAIGPWDGPRRPPPVVGALRLTFLVGGEIRFGEGPIDALARDTMGGPVLAAAGRLLAGIVDRVERGRPA